MQIFVQIIIQFSFRTERFKLQSQYIFSEFFKISTIYIFRLKNVVNIINYLKYILLLQHYTYKSCLINI